MTTFNRDMLYIGGAWVNSKADGRFTDVMNAADGTLLGSVPNAGEADVLAAIASARAAFEGWAQTPPWIRANYLAAVRDYLAEHQEAIARVIALEVGMPLRMALKIQAALPLATLDRFIEAVRAMEWSHTLENSLVVKEPVGVVAAITPWNYPLHQLVGKFGGALGAGCTLVAKPANVAPLSCFYLADACHAAGIPPGVFNLVSGAGREIGELLAGHRDIDLISFTGSTGVGVRIAQLAAPNITRVALELGGKSASIVLDDADLPRAIRTSVGNCLLNSGQTCTAWTRLIVPKARQAEVVKLAIAAALELAVGHPLDPASRLGPLASAQQQQSVEAFIARAQQNNDGTLVWRGQVPATQGFYVAPAIFADVDPASELAQEEVFGPVLAIIPHDGEDHAVAIANNSRYGLAGGVWSQDTDRALAVARRIRTGQVDINGAPFNPCAPFGGFKQSGYGREFGPHGIDDFMELKSIQRRL